MTNTPSTGSDLGPGRPNIEQDRARLWDVIKGGGIAIVPSNLGYGVWGGSREATERIIKTKRRGAHKRQGIVMGDAGEREIHILDQRQRDIIDCITKDYDLPLGVIAPYRPEHPVMQKIVNDPYLLAVGTYKGTISTALNAGGPFHAEIASLSMEHCVPIFGSSANLTGTGVKYRVEDIEPEIVEIADIVLDYGLRRYHAYKVASTQINFATMEVTRAGSCHEMVAEVLKRHFNWEIPPDPGREAAPHGHLQEFAMAEVSE